MTSHVKMACYNDMLKKILNLRTSAEKTLKPLRHLAANACTWPTGVHTSRSTWSGAF